MTDTEIKANLHAFEQRIQQLEQKIEHMAEVGDTIEVAWPLPLHSYVYEQRNVVIQAIEKAHGDEVEE